MATTLRYGEANLAAFPDNTSGLISAENMRDFVVSTRTSFINISDDTPFTASMSSGVPTLINPLLPSPTVNGVLWKADGNNRAYQDYVNVIPDLTIPAGYTKLITITFSLGVEKSGSLDRVYLFQADLDGTPVGNGVVHTIISEPLFFSTIVSMNMTYDVSHYIGLSVTPQGHSDDLNFESFQQTITDYQLWSAPA